MLGQRGAGQRLSDWIVADIGELAHAVEQAERVKDTRIDTDTDTGVPGFDLLQSRAGGKGALRHDCHWQPATPAGIADVGAELAQGAPHSGGRVVRCWHLRSSHYRTYEHVVGS